MDSTQFRPAPGGRSVIARSPEEILELLREAQAAGQPVPPGFGSPGMVPGAPLVPQPLAPSGVPVPGPQFNAPQATSGPQQGPNTGPGPQSAPELPVPPVPPLAPPPIETPQQAPPPVSPVAPSAPGGPPGGNRWAAASPPPPQFAGFVAEASQKYGVPERIMHWVGHHESGWNPAAVGIPTRTGRAKGMWQFMDGTAKEQGGFDPHDPAGSTEGAARYLRKLYDRTGSWETALASYGTFSTGRGPEADAAVREGFRQYMGGVAPTSAPQASPASPAPAGAPSEDPFLKAMLSQQDGDRRDLRAAAEASRPTKSDALMALAQGFLSGDTLKEGFGNAVGNARVVTKEGREGLLRAAQIQASLGKSGVDTALALSGMGLRNRGLDQGQQRIGLGGDANALRGDANAIRAAQVQAEADAKAARLALDKDKFTDLKENSEDRRVSAKNRGEWNKQFSELQAGTSNRLKLKQTIANQRAIIESDPNLQGSDVRNQFVRFMSSTFGLLADPNTLSLSEKNSTNLQTEVAKSAFGGSISGRTALGEFNQVIKGALSLNTNPAAARILLDEADKIVDAEDGAANELLRRMGEGETLEDVVGKLGGTHGWVAKFHQDYHTTNKGVGTPKNPDSPTITKPQGGQWQSTEPTTGLGYTRIR